MKLQVLIKEILVVFHFANGHRALFLVQEYKRQLKNYYIYIYIYIYIYMHKTFTINLLEGIHERLMKPTFAMYFLQMRHKQLSGFHNLIF